MKYLDDTAGEIAQEYGKRQMEDASITDLMELVQQVVSFHMKHNAEYEAVDILMEVEDLDLLTEHVDSTNYKRTSLYLTSAAKYLPGPDDMLVLDIAYTIYLKFQEYPRALQIALFLDNIQEMEIAAAASKLARVSSDYFPSWQTTESLKSHDGTQRSLKQ